MDRLLELIDSIKQTIPDQTYIDMMAALSEIQKSEDQSDQWQAIPDYIDQQENSHLLYRYLPPTCFMDTGDNGDIGRLPFVMIDSLNYLVSKVVKLEQQVIWAVGNAQYAGMRHNKQMLIDQWQRSRRSE